MLDGFRRWRGFSFFAHHPGVRRPSRTCVKLCGKKNVEKREVSYPEISLFGNLSLALSFLDDPAAVSNNPPTFYVEADFFLDCAVFYPLYL